MYNREPRKVVAYGAGKMLKEKYYMIPHIDMVCDLNAENIKNINGMEVYHPNVLCTLHEPIYIIVCILDSDIFYEVCVELNKYDIDAVVFHLFNNISFGYSWTKTPASYKKMEATSKLKVNIVTYDTGWIFKKFVDRMYENLIKNDVEVTVSSSTKKDVDINHHIQCAEFEPFQNDTLMITHVDNEKLFLLIKKQLQVARMGICMSRDTMEQLILYGIPRSKLCYINPAHDGIIKPHKYVIGITHRCYDWKDVRKRATAVLDIISVIDPEYFKFIIMGSGWDKIVDIMNEKGFEVTYYPEFDYDTYNVIMQKIDYYLYEGFDEGSMGYLDAVTAGAGTIVTPQGFHLDAKGSIDYPCTTVKEFQAAFLDLQEKRKRRIETVSDWTWENYTLKHMDIWNYILHRKSFGELFKNQLCYQDGINSIMMSDVRLYKKLI
jgi:hypothetical protein